MDIFDNPVEVLSMATVILVLLLNTHWALSLTSEKCNHDESFPDVDIMTMNMEASSSAVDAMTQATLMHYRLWNTQTFLDEDLGFWVKSRSTTWFSRFLMHEYDDARWVQMFRFTKRFVLTLAQLLSPTIRRRDTKYRLAIPVVVRLACTLFKLSHGASLLVCNEMFVVGRSTVSIMLREVVHAINILLRSEISWPSSEASIAIASEFKQLCGLPGVMGAIDGTHIAISKPRVGVPDYYYFKSGGYSINCQAVVDSSKRFLDLYVGMPGSTHDCRMLRRSTLFSQGQRNSLWDNSLSFDGFAPYLLGDGSYPLMPWLMVPHRHFRNIPIAQQFFNRRLSRGRAVVENAFGQLKLTFQELNQKSDLQVIFLPDVVTYCTLLHNVLLEQSHEDIERLLDVLRTEGAQRFYAQDEPTMEDEREAPSEANVCEESQVKRRELAVYVSLQRMKPT